MISLVLGAVEFLSPIEDALRIGRNAMHAHAASGNIVVLAIDDRSIEGLEQWPWHRARYAQIVDALNAAGAREIVFQEDFAGHSATEDDARLKDALDRFPGRIALPVRSVRDSATGQSADIFPAAAFRKHADLVNANLTYNRQNLVWKLPYSVATRGKIYPSMAAYLGHRSGQHDQTFRMDYSVALKTIPVISAIDLLQGKIAPGALDGKSVVIGTTSLQLSQLYFVPATGQVPAIYLHVLGAETLLEGRPLALGWAMPLAVVFFLVATQLYTTRRWASRIATGASIALIIGAPMLLERHLIFIDIMPAAALVLIASGLHAWIAFRRSYRVRGLTNIVSGLPNLNALRDEVKDRKAALVAARVQNFAEITSALPHDAERALVEQIVARLALGTRGEKIYQGDEGVFVWLAVDDSEAALGDQLEALHALCRTPLSVADTNIDLVMSFGIDGGTERSVANRIGGALVAADEASAEGRRWKRFDAAKLKDAAWNLSLLGRLDAAIDSGEIWVAYQPKIDLRRGRIVGAEALVRWSHAEKGEIGPSDFIPAAEQHNRIDKLTAHVLEAGIRTAATINAGGGEFDVAVNLSARLLDRPDLIGRIEALLAKHGVAPRHLTLEVTESAAMTGQERSLETLKQLRELGLNISIDDYGTGFSTLDYLKRIPATEIKIDRSFVKMIDRSQSDRLMVDSTIHLAHSLGRTVVAEGVETVEILRALEAMGCDKAQGFLLGRPMPLRNFTRLMVAERRSSAA